MSLFKYKEKPPATKPVKMPKNRWELLGDILKNQFSLVVNLSLLCSLFGLPLIAVYSVMYRLLLNALATGNVVGQVFSTVFYFALGAIPCYVLWFMGLNGAFAVTKKTVWNQGCVLKTTFWQGIKSAKAAIMGAIFGVVAFAAVEGMMFMLLYGKTHIQQGIGIGACAIVLVLFINVCAFFLAGNAVYEMPFGALLKNSISFACMTILRGLALVVGFVGIPLTMIILHNISAYVALAIIVLLLQGMGVLAWTLSSHAAFDKYINKDCYPDYVNKGLDITIKGE